MIDVTNLCADAIYNHFRREKQQHYDEEKHCKLLVSTIGHARKGTVSSFCVEAMICEKTFYNWIDRYELFRNIYHYCKMVAKEIWEGEGREFKDTIYCIDQVNYDFEYWKMKGWSRFGISKNSKIRINSKETDTAITLYARILKQAGDGDFTASEFKQLMEAVNVGLNVHQISLMQKEIDSLKEDLTIMIANQNGNNTSSDKSVT